MKHIILETRNLDVHISHTQILFDVSLSIPRHQITAVIGPSGCGKSLLLRCMNRMTAFISDISIRGDLLFYKKNLLKMDPVLVRRNIGMIFQKPNPFPNMSVFENVIAGYSINGIALSDSEKNYVVETSLNRTGLFSEVKDILYRDVHALTPSQQQRLCIARALAMNPRVLLLDDSMSALEPNESRGIEELLMELKKSVTIVTVTHSIAQASRISDNTAFLYMGKLVEFGKTQKLFTVPKYKQTEAYLTGEFG